jgi:hypothetical protein
MMARQLQKGVLYFLAMEDPAGGSVPPFYKIGVTTDTVDKRIRQLQTGNPFRIVPHTTMVVEGAEFVERHLHRLYSAKRRLLEWFTFSPNELQEVIETAEAYSAEFSDLVVETRKTDSTHSTDDLISPAPEALNLHEEAVRLEGQKTQNGLRKAVIKSQILALVGTSRGVPGIVTVAIYKPVTSFKKALLKNDDPDLYDQYMTITTFKQSMTVLGKAKPSDFAQLFDEQKQAAAGVPKVGPDDVTDVRLDRTDDSVDLHDTYIRLLQKGATISIDLDLVKMKLKTQCGDAAGIEGVCTYLREDKTSFDKEKFEQDHPDLHDEYTTTGTSMRRVSVKRSRDY